MFTFRLGYCSACGRFKPLEGRKTGRCFDCRVANYTKRTKYIPYRVIKKEGEL